MIYTQLSDNETVSRLGMGNMRLPVKTFGTRINKSEAQKIIDYAMRSGINYYDTAYVYHLGQSEKFLGDALSKYPRDSYKLATKYLILAGKNYKKVFENQLKRLKTEHIDYYLLHSVMDRTADSYIKSGAIEYFQEQKEKGRIGHLGFSSHASPETLVRFANQADWDFAQIQLNYYDWFFSKTQEEYNVLRDRSIPIVVMEPLRGGKLASLNKEAEGILQAAHPEWSIPSWGFRFLQGLPQVKVILSGMSSMDQIIDNVNTFQSEQPLSAEDQQTLIKALEAYKGQIQIPCTGCKYCASECPKEINIPAFLEVYNSYKAQGRDALEQLGLIESKGQPEDCVKCGKCAMHCPQNIQIPEVMAELVGLKGEMKRWSY